MYSRSWRYIYSLPPPPNLSDQNLTLKYHTFIHEDGNFTVLRGLSYEHYVKDKADSIPPLGWTGFHPPTLPRVELRFGVKRTNLIENFWLEHYALHHRGLFCEGQKLSIIDMLVKPLQQQNV